MPKATAVFDADDSRLGAALVRINHRMLALQERVAKFAGAWLAIEAVAHVVAAGFEHLRGALEVGDKLNDLSANTGVAVADLVVLQQEFANAGKSAEDLGPAFAKMAKSIHGDAAGDTIAKLGLDLEALKRKTPAEQFRALGAAINQVQDPSQRAAMAMEVFGRSGAEMLSVFASSTGFADGIQGGIAGLQQEFADARKSADDLGPALATAARSMNAGGSAASIAKLGLNLDDLKRKTSAEQFRAVGTAISQIKDPSQQAAMAMEIFGRSSAKMLSVLGSNGFVTSSRADMLRLQQEFTNAGKSAEDLRPVFAAMNKSISSDAAGASVAKLGLHLDDLKRKTPAEQFRALGAAINQVKDPSQRAAIAMEIFGRSGAGLLAVFASSGFADGAQAGMVRLQQEFANAGKSAGDLGPAFAQMTKSLNDNTATAAMAKLGLNLDALNQKTPAEQFQVLGAAINQVKDPSQRAALAMEFFGRSGAKVLSVLASSGFTDGAQAGILGLQQEFAKAGTSAEDLGPAFAAMAKSMSSDAAGASIAKLGLHLDDLKRKTPAEQFRTLGAAINQVKDPSERAAMAMEIFGHSGARLLSVFASSGFADGARSGLLTLQREFANADKSAEDLGPAFAQMTKSLNSDAAGASMARLGLNLDDLKRKTPAEQFRVLGAALNQIQDPSQRAARAMEVFGHSGTGLLAVFASSGFAEGAQAGILALQRELTAAGKSAEDLGPAFAQMTKSLNGNAAADTVQKLGLDLDTLKRKTSAEQFRALGVAINQLNDPSHRAAMAMEFFGHSGARLLSVLASSNGFAARSQAGMLRLQQEFAKAGTSAEDLGPAFATMAKSMSSDAAGASIQKLGLHLDDLKRKTPAEQFRTLGAAINQVKVPSQRAAMAMEFFGRSGIGLLAVLASNRFGEDSQGIARLQQEFALAGRSTEGLGQALAQMGKSLNDDATANTIQNLGLNLDDLKHKTPAEQFHALGAAINQVKDPSERAAVAMEIFGRSGAGLLSVFAEGAQAGIVGLQQELANAGKSADDLGPAFAQMAKSISSDAAGASMAKLGLDLDALKQKAPAEQFRALGAAISQIKDPSQRAAAAMEVLGRSGAELLSVFSASGFDDAAEQVGSQAQILGRDAALFDDVSDKLEATGMKVRGFWVGVADQVAPVLKPLLDQFMKMDLATWGQQAGEAVALIVQAFADRKIGDILFISAKIAFANAVNFLAGAVVGVAQALWQAFSESIENAITLFEILTTADFWVGMGKALLGIAQGFIAFLLEGVAKLLDDLKDVPLIGDKVGDTAQSMRQTAQGFRDAGQDNREAGADLLTPAFEKATERMRDALANIGKALGEGFDKGNTAIDTSQWQQQLEDAVGGVMQRVKDVSDKSRADAKPRQQNTGAYDEDLDAKKKPATSALQKIGGGGRTAYSTGDPMLREQQRQTRELSTQTGLLRDVKKLLDKPPVQSKAPTPVFG